MSTEPDTAPPPFEPIPERIRAHARARPDQAALVEGEERLDYGRLDALMDRIAATLSISRLTSAVTRTGCASLGPP